LVCTCRGRGWKRCDAKRRKIRREFKLILDAAFEAQLEGAFADEAAGCAWLDAYLAKGS
jgi:hypothetical protein